MRIVAEAGRGPAGTAAKTGNAGSGPRSTSSARTAVPVPTAKPGPQR